MVLENGRKYARRRQAEDRSAEGRKRRSGRELIRRTETPEGSAKGKRTGQADATSGMTGASRTAGGSCPMEGPAEGGARAGSAGRTAEGRGTGVEEVSNGGF